jgi:hypothetical protein
VFTDVVICELFWGCAVYQVRRDGRSKSTREIGGRKGLLRSWAGLDSVEALVPGYLFQTFLIANGGTHVYRRENRSERRPEVLFARVTHGVHGLWRLFSGCPLALLLERIHRIARSMYNSSIASLCLATR